MRKNADAGVLIQRSNKYVKMFKRCYLRGWPYLFAVLTLQRVETRISISAECRENITLPCDAIHHSKTFRAVTWYKFNISQRTGIVRKNSQVVKSYNFPRVAVFGDKECLMLPDVRPEDSGTYECLVSANVGGTNRDSMVFLNVSECVTPAPAVFTTPLVTGTDVLFMARKREERRKQLWT
ncbi:uncharacterized protein LOC118781391 isoform X2 [Megalops cyprinoides]|uniref:uncharacterized protein LOC118781391 isoform X2 n=1 Tax=Megalops cyprinoides TaxID=118141 RepID=UPI001864FE2B|nr:uncharacterized protein LOC118781391 isoform X2 [Megalops cyprinoides]